MRAQLAQNQTNQILVHAVAIALLLLVALTLATKFGMIHCSQIPYWCSGYRWIVSTVYGRTYPNIMILHGDSGMGDPELLSRLFEDKCNLYPVVDKIDNVSAGNLENYDVVIVEKARQLTPEQMRMLWEFTAKGGRLLVIGDVGVEPSNPSEIVTVDEFNKDSNEPVPVVKNIWDRKDELGRYVLFGTRFLGLKYLGNYCNESNCSVSGVLRVHRDILTAGIPEAVPFPLNFAVVEDWKGSVLGPHTIVATIANVAPVYGRKPPYPAIIRAGYRMIYMAFPPEELWKVINDQARKGSVPPYASAALIIQDLCNWASS